tara:strand:+ start:35 stop:523 length:489 start_codon:yes stop_codon:yes gene_type:complete
MNKIHPTAIIYPNVTLGDNIYIGAFCIIGAPAEHKLYWGKESKHSVHIGEGAIIHGHVTIDAGTERTTFIGDDTFIMKHVYIGHDSFIGHGATLSAHVSIGGFSNIGYNANIGMGATVHQKTSVGSNCMIGMNTTITKKSIIESGGCYIGTPAKFLRWNKRK